MACSAPSTPNTAPPKMSRIAIAGDGFFGLIGDCLAQDCVPVAADLHWARSVASRPHNSTVVREATYRPCYRNHLSWPARGWYDPVHPQIFDNLSIMVSSVHQRLHY